MLNIYAVYRYWSFISMFKSVLDGKVFIIILIFQNTRIISHEHDIPLFLNIQAIILDP